MLAIALALASALAFGTSDFIGGVTSRRAPYALVSLAAQVVAVAAVTAVALLFPGTPSGSGIAWGLVAGVGAAVGTLALYRGFSRGRMSVVAPLSALGSAGFPALVGIATGDRLRPFTVVGLVLALPAVWLVASVPDTADDARKQASGAPEGLIAGLGFGSLFVGLAQAGTSGGFWPVVSSQIGSLAVIAATVIVLVGRGMPLRRPPLVATTPGLFAATATVLFFVATGLGSLTIIGVISALYPGATVLLAAIVLRERATRRQGLGLALATGAVVAFALTG